MKNMKKISSLILVLAIIALALFTLLSSNLSNTETAGINYSPNTGDTPWEMILFIGLGIVAVALLVFVVMRRKR